MGFRGAVVSESPAHPGTGEREWALHPEVVKRIWAQFGRAEVDLFASRRNSHCALWFSMALSDDPPLGVDAFAHEPWP